MSNLDQVPFSVITLPEGIKTALVNFFRSLGRDIDPINDDTNLIEDTGASSDEGVDFVLDLEEMLDTKIPNDFNPFVHPSGKRGMTFRELVQHAERFIAVGAGGNHASS